MMHPEEVARLPRNPRASLNGVHPRVVGAENDIHVLRHIAHTGYTSPPLIEIGLRTGTAMRILKRLKKDNLVHDRPCELARQKTLWMLTADGLAKVRAKSETRIDYELDSRRVIIRDQVRHWLTVQYVALTDFPDLDWMEFDKFWVTASALGVKRPDVTIGIGGRIVANEIERTEKRDRELHRALLASVALLESAKPEDRVHSVRYVSPIKSLLEHYKDQLTRPVPIWERSLVTRFSEKHDRNVNFVEWRIVDRRQLDAKTIDAFEFVHRPELEDVL